jgi:fumarate reductase subunit D
MSLLSRVEPVLWMLFGAGAMVCAMLRFPLGWFGTPAETFERMRFLIGNAPVKYAIGAMLSLVFWHSAHHLRHFAYDLGYHNGAVAPLVYALAALGTLASFGVVSGL